MRRPRLTASVARGLRDAASVVSVNLENGDCGGFATCTEPEIDDVHAALRYMYALADWYDGRAVAAVLAEGGAP